MNFEGAGWSPLPSTICGPNLSSVFEKNRYSYKPVALRTVLRDEGIRNQNRQVFLHLHREMPNQNEKQQGTIWQSDDTPTTPHYKVRYFARTTHQGVWRASNNTMESHFCYQKRGKGNSKSHFLGVHRGQVNQTTKPQAISKEQCTL